MSAASISRQAYAKVVLHSARHAAAAVGGLLLGTQAADGSEVRVVDALPVYHGNPVGPVFEVAWALFDQQAEWQAGAGAALRVVGVYFALEELKRAGSAEATVPAFIEALLQAVRDKSSGGAGTVVLLELDGNLVNAGADVLCTVLAKQPGNSTIKTLAPLDSTVAKLNSHVDELLRAGKHRTLVDVETHMESGESVLNSSIV